jgi:cysteine desulfurase / selenocysteine lyase
MSLFPSEAERLRQFPVAGEQIFLGHAGVTPLPRCAAAAIQHHAEASCRNHQEFGSVLKDVSRTREVCAGFLGVDKSEIALLGPTSLGLSLFANGLDWQAGDEIVCYRDDYPANVYPWTALAARGVVIRFVQPTRPGRITLDDVSAALRPSTRLVALASCHYLTGWRIDVSAIGALLRERGVLFSLDAIQTLGAFPVDGTAVDFLSADAHKWMLGPLAIGIVFVARRNFFLCRPTLLGAWNVRSPDFIAQDDITFPDTAQRYEPGVLNITGMYGMKASLDLLRTVGPDRVSTAILANADHLHERLATLGFEFLSPDRSEPLRSGIVTTRHPQVPGTELFAALEKARISASLRADRTGTPWLRFSPHFYNTFAELDEVGAVLDNAVRGRGTVPTG